MKKNKIRKAFIFFVTFAVLAMISTIVIGNYFVDYALLRNPKGGNRRVKAEIIIKSDIEDKISKVKKAEKIKLIKWQSDIRNKIKEVTVKSKDNLELKGHTYSNKGNDWIIVVHGYQSTEEASKILAMNFYIEGYNILTMNLRTHGESEGKFIGMGILDKFDIEKWIQYIVGINPNANIILHGTSMGGFTVLETGALKLPGNVKLLIDDCGYTSVWDIFKLELRKRFGLPAFPVLDMANTMAKIRAKYSMKRGNALESVKKSKLPTLFIHTDQDDFVPMQMSKDLYNAKNKELAELLIIEGGGHTDAKYVDKERYYAEIFKFIKNRK